ncbi:glycosyltransferase family 4 protein [Chryseolinea soli]|uniref:starch synthase n=1 Tax=Chryseolinea soli TaxID=2321403 RepID=A0A385SS88_9BACT|nr:glycosyltransferase family 4 protein [Chryseolinea soli]AYB33007.1 glycosyltransferase family 1 protein [Chryseolinea soli]
MKVLMFGWEFPPHISGGLGTACYGLTQSLRLHDVEIVLVVPKLHGDEPDMKFDLIDASHVTLRKKNGRMAPRVIAAEPPFDIAEEPPAVVAGYPPAFVVSGPEAHRKSPVYTTREIEDLTTLEIPSYLSPYVNPAMNVLPKSMTVSTKRRMREAVILETDDKKVEKRMEMKNEDTYNDKDKASDNDNVDDHPDDTGAMAQLPEEGSDFYAFSGKYGPDLLEETKYYAAVAAEVSRRHTFDVIHVHDWMTFPAGLAAKEASGKPLVVHVHSTEFDRSGEIPHAPVYEIEKAGFEGADSIVAVSGWTKRIIESRYHIAPSKVKVAYNGVMPREITPLVHGHPFGPHVVTFLGRLTYQKGPLYFVKAAYQVLEKFPDAHFIVAGSGDMLPQVIEEVAHLRISTRFHFTGFLKGDNVEKVWSMTKVYVMPSVSEPFGITPLEAIQAGIPVIVSNQSGVSEVMSHVIKVDFWNTHALANAICNVLAHESLSTTLRENSKSEIQQITWSKAAKKIKTIYHELTT